VPRLTRNTNTYYYSPPFSAPFHIKRYSVLAYEPSIILPAIHDIVNIHPLVLDLIQNQIPFFNEHLMIFVRRNKFALEKGYACIIQMDGDGQHDPAYVGELLSVVRSGEADVALGSRFKSEGKKGTYKAGFVKKAGMEFFSLLTSMLIGQKVTDPTSGYQALNNKVLKFYASDIYPFDFPDADVLIMLHRAGFRIREVPVVMHQSQNNRGMHRGMVPVYYVFKMFLSIFVELLRKTPKEENTVKVIR